MRIVLAGGGSGGHITPILAVASALKSPNRELHYIGIGEAREQALVASHEVVAHKIQAGKFRRYHNRTLMATLLDVPTLLRNARDLIFFLVGVLQSLWLLLRLRPECVFIKGGFVGLPVGVAAFLLRIPFLIHESDSVPGLANRMLAKLTPNRVSGFDIPGFENLGNPVRAEIIQPHQVDRMQFDINNDKPIILAFGGSLGSHALNKAVLELAKHTNEYEIIHVSGQDETVAFDAPHYHEYSFLSEDMAAALHIASVVVARAGANTLAELAALKKVSIIVPHPHLSGNHQAMNAESLANSSAAFVLPQEELTSDNLQKILKKAVYDDEIREKMTKNIAQFNRPDAAEQIASRLLACADSRRGGE